MQRNSIVNSARQEGFVHAATVSAAGFGLASARTCAASAAWGLGAEAQALLVVERMTARRLALVALLLAAPARAQDQDISARAPRKRPGNGGRTVSDTRAGPTCAGCGHD